MSAECSECGGDITYPVGTWPLGECEPCKLRAALTLVTGLTGGMLAQLRDEDPAGWGGWVQKRVAEIHRAASEPLAAGAVPWEMLSRTGDSDG